jgi:hypothetical protein
MDEVHVKLYLQIAEAGYIPATSELNKDILPNQAASLHSGTGVVCGSSEPGFETLGKTWGWVFAWWVRKS